MLTIVPAGAPDCKFPALHIEFPAPGEESRRGDRQVRRVTPVFRCLEAVMNRDPRCALSQELEAKQTLLDQLHALAAEDPDFFTDLVEGGTNLLELIAALDTTILDDEILVDGAKAALDNSRIANAPPRPVVSSSAGSSRTPCSRSASRPRDVAALETDYSLCVRNEFVGITSRAQRGGQLSLARERRPLALSHGAIHHLSFRTGKKAPPLP
jgi:hypothetical protein